MLPFTPAQFLTVFTEYNLAIWPSQIVAYLLGGMAVLLLFWQTAGPRRLIAVVLSAMWIWTGVLYHGVWFSQVNKSAYLFATLFVIEGAVFSWRAHTEINCALASAAMPQPASERHSSAMLQLSIH
jgi:hypothetical protein